MRAHFLLAISAVHAEAFLAGRRSCARQSWTASLYIKKEVECDRFDDQGNPMISFVWQPHAVLPAGVGGSENYTVGQVRELNRRGIPAQIVTIGVGEDDGRAGFPGVPFHAVPSIADIERLGGTIVFVTFFPEVATMTRAYQMLHIPPPVLAHDRARVARQIQDRHPIAVSRFAAQTWAKFLGRRPAEIDVVYPFAEPSFARQPRRENRENEVRVLFAGRLSPEKGIFTLLEMVHNELFDAILADVRVTVTVTDAGSDKPQGEIIRRMLTVHPGIRLIRSKKSAEDMAALMASQDVVLMPSNSQYWHETFGIVSVEAQHAGSRVVASRDGGLPETDCGGLILVDPDDAAALARGLRAAIDAGPVDPLARARAARRFTVAQSVDQLLQVLHRDRSQKVDRAPHRGLVRAGRPRPTARERAVSPVQVARV